jgi:hypothetical protein
MQRIQDSSSFKSPNFDMESHAVALPSTFAQRFVQSVPGLKWLIGFPVGISVKTRSTGPSFPIMAFAYDRYSFHNGKCIYFRVSGFCDPRCQEFPILLNPQSSMSQFTDMVPYVLALLAKFLTHVTTISQDRSLISCRVFRLCNVEMYSSSGFMICRIPICRYDDSWPYNGCFSLGRDSGLRNSSVYGLLAHGIPDSRWITFLVGPSPNAPISTTRPPKMDGPNRFSRFWSFRC